MACMDHHCRQCDFIWLNNEPREPCPICDSNEVTHIFDEEFDHYDPREEAEGASPLRE